MFNVRPENGDRTNSSAPLSLLLGGGWSKGELYWKTDFHWIDLIENNPIVSGDRSTLSSHDQTRYAVWDAGACRQERDPHDDIRDSQSVANYSHLKEAQRHTWCDFNDHSGCLQIHCRQFHGLKRLALIFLISLCSAPTWTWPIRGSLSIPMWWFQTRRIQDLEHEKHIVRIFQSNKRAFHLVTD